MNILPITCPPLAPLLHSTPERNTSPSPTLPKEKSSTSSAQYLLNEIHQRKWLNTAGAIAPPANLLVPNRVKLNPSATANIDEALTELAQITRETTSPSETIHQRSHLLQALLHSVLETKETSSCLQITGGAVLWLLVRSRKALDQLLTPFIKDGQKRDQLVELIANGATKRAPNDMDLRLISYQANLSPSTQLIQPLETDYFNRFITPLKNRFSPSQPLKNRYSVCTDKEFFFVHTIQMDQLAVDLLRVFKSARLYIANSDALVMNISKTTNRQLTYELVCQNPKGSPLCSLLSALTPEMEIPAAEEVNAKGLESLLSRYLQGKYLSQAVENGKVEASFLSRWLAFLEQTPHPSIGQLLTKRVTNHHGNHPNGLFLLAWHLSLLSLQFKEKNQGQFLPLWRQIDQKRAVAPFCHPLLDHLFSLYKDSGFDDNFLIMAQALLSHSKEGCYCSYTIKKVPHLGNPTLQIALADPTERGLPTLYLSLLRPPNEAHQSLRLAFSQLDPAARLRLCFASWSLLSLLQKEFPFQLSKKLAPLDETAPLFAPLQPGPKGSAVSQESLWLFQGNESFSLLRQAPLFYLQATIQVAPLEWLYKLLPLYFTHHQSDSCSLLQLLTTNTSLTPTQQLSLWIEAVEQSTKESGQREMAAAPLEQLESFKRGGAASDEELLLLHRIVSLCLRLDDDRRAAELWLHCHDAKRAQVALGLSLLRRSLDKCSSPPPLFGPLLSTLCPLRLDATEESELIQLLMAALEREWTKGWTIGRNTLQLSTGVRKRLCRQLAEGEPSDKPPHLLFAGWQLLLSQVLIEQTWSTTIAPFLTRSLLQLKDSMALRKLIDEHYPQLSQALLPTQWGQLLLHLAVHERVGQSVTLKWKQEAFLLLARTHYFGCEPEMWPKLLAWSLEEPSPASLLTSKVDGHPARYLPLVAGEEATSTLFRLLLLFPTLLASSDLRSTVEQRLYEAIKRSPPCSIALQLIEKGAATFSPPFWQGLVDHLEKLPAPMAEQLVNRLSWEQLQLPSTLHAIGRAGLAKTAWNKTPLDKRQCFLTQLIKQLPEQQLFPLVNEMIASNKYHQLALRLLLNGQGEKERSSASACFKMLVQKKWMYLDDYHPLLLCHFRENRQVWKDYLNALPQLSLPNGSALWEQAPSYELRQQVVQQTLHSFNAQRPLDLAATQQLLNWILQLIEEKPSCSLGLSNYFLKQIKTLTALAHYPSDLAMRFLNWALAQSAPCPALFPLLHDTKALPLFDSSEKKQLSLSLITPLKKQSSTLDLPEQLRLLLHYEIEPLEVWNAWLQQAWPSNWPELLLPLLSEATPPAEVIPLLLEKMAASLTPSKSDLFFASRFKERFFQDLHLLKPHLIKKEDSTLSLLIYLFNSDYKIDFELPKEAILTLAEIAIEKLPRNDTYKKIFESIFNLIKNHQLSHKLLKNEYDYSTNRLIFEFIPDAVDIYEIDAALPLKIWIHYFIKNNLLKEIEKQFHKDPQSIPIAAARSCFMSYNGLNFKELRTALAEELQKIYPYEISDTEHLNLLNVLHLFVKQKIFSTQDCALVLKSNLFLTTDRKRLHFLQLFYNAVIEELQPLPEELAQLHQAFQWFSEEAPIGKDATPRDWANRCHHFLYCRAEADSSFLTFYDRFATTGLPELMVKPLKERVLFLIRLIAKGDQLTSYLHSAPPKRPISKELREELIASQLQWARCTSKIETKMVSPNTEASPETLVSQSAALNESHLLLKLIERLLPSLLSEAKGHCPFPLIKLLFTNIDRFFLPLIESYSTSIALLKFSADEAVWRPDETKKKLKELNEQMQQMSKILKGLEDKLFPLLNSIDQKTFFNNYKVLQLARKHPSKK